jgi:hypothetical protein
MRTLVIRVTAAATISLLALVGAAISNPAFAGGVSGTF